MYFAAPDWYADPAKDASLVRQNPRPETTRGMEKGSVIYWALF